MTPDAVVYERVLAEHQGRGTQLGYETVEVRCYCNERFKNWAAHRAHVAGVLSQTIGIEPAHEWRRYANGVIVERHPTYRLRGLEGNGR